MPRETTSSLIYRIASRYGLKAKALRSCWRWRNHRPKHEGGTCRADAEVLLNAAGRQLLAGLCGVEEGVLARALPSWGREDADGEIYKTVDSSRGSHDPAREPGKAGAQGKGARNQQGSSAAGVMSGITTPRRRALPCHTQSTKPLHPSVT